MASSSTSYVQKSFKYDVFLSFMGEDTRKTFVDHLYHALESRGIITYKDDEKIEKGNRISDELMGSIEESRFYIIVFSKNYASSSWCLDELVKIMDCQTMDEHTAYPVFYDVEPPEIRKQSGSVGVAFAKYQKEEAAGEWRDAMEKAASLAGWELKNTANGHEAMFIKGIVDKISLKLLCINLSVDRNLVGMEGRVKDVLSSLKIGIDDVRMIGIKGMGGAGKTTLAKAIFEQISIWFEGSSFVENVREVSKGSPKGMRSLQKQVLSDVIDQQICVSSVVDGKNKMKKMLHGRKVLIVLDDVDNIDQLDALAGEHTWFKPGSRIIITTREEQVLETHQVDLIRDVNLLSDEEAICLFNRYAFRNAIPNQEYEELSKRVVRYAVGLPLTVKVLGSFLYLKTIDEWTDALQRLKTIPLKETLQILELSYNGLEDDYKEIFLDVACILKGWEKDEAIKALEGRGFHAKIGLKVLEQKSLITISNPYGSRCVLGMHDHIEEMGKNIVRRQHPHEPHEHSRLWINDEIEVILAKDLGTKATRCIHLVYPKFHPATIMKGLRKMEELRFLHVINYGAHDEDLYLENWESYASSQYLPDSLQYLYWYSYPFTCLPKNFQATNVVPVQMLESNIAQLWEGGERKVLDKLKFLNLSGSKLRTLDLGPAPNLETLILSHCSNLVKLHMHSETPKLKFLDLSYNHHLRIIHVGRSPSLEVLSLANCDNLEELHLSVGSVKLKSLDFINRSKLRTLDLSQTLNLEKLHIEGCGNLVELHMPAELKSLCLKKFRVRTLDLAQIRNLEEIIIESCEDLVELIMPVESLKLKTVQLFDCKLRTLDLVQVQNIEEIIIRVCRDLVELMMPVKLKILQLSHCMLRILDLTRTSNLEKLVLYSCVDLVELHMPIESLKLKTLKLSNCNYRTPDFARTPNLETLLLPEVPKDLHQLPSLEKLTLCSEKIKHLPNSICMLKHLKLLSLQSCWLLEQLPEDIGRLVCLEELILSSKMIKHLPNSICMLKQLKVLNLGSCYLLEQLPEDLGRLECLEELDLTECIFLRDIPDSICEMKHLVELRLCFCFLLEKLPQELGHLEHLSYLYIECAGITRLPRSLYRLKGLHIIGSKWRLESYGLTSMSTFLTYTAWCDISS